MIVSWCKCCGYAFASDNHNQVLCRYCPSVVENCYHAMPENNFGVKKETNSQKALEELHDRGEK